MGVCWDPLLSRVIGTRACCFHQSSVILDLWSSSFLVMNRLMNIARAFDSPVLSATDPDAFMSDGVEA